MANIKTLYYTCLPP